MTFIYSGPAHHNHCVSDACHCCQDGAAAAAPLIPACGSLEAFLSSAGLDSSKAFRDRKLAFPSPLNGFRCCLRGEIRVYLQLLGFFYLFQYDSDHSDKEKLSRIWRSFHSLVIFYSDGNDTSEGLLVTLECVNSLITKTPTHGGRHSLETRFVKCATERIL